MLEHGTDITKGIKGAIQESSPEIIHVLFDQELPENLRSNPNIQLSDSSPLEMALFVGSDIDTIRALLSCGADARFITENNNFYNQDGYQYVAEAADLTRELLGTRRKLPLKIATEIPGLLTTKRQILQTNPNIASIQFVLDETNTIQIHCALPLKNDTKIVPGMAVQPAGP